MRCGWHRALFLLLVLLPLALAQAASFSGCFPSERLERFWLSRDYVQSNPYVLHLVVSNIYSFNFEKSLLADGQQHQTILPGSVFIRLSGAPDDSWGNSPSLLDSANSSLACASNSAAKAQAMLNSARSSVSSQFGLTSIMPTGLLDASLISPAMKLAGFINYAMNFEGEYSISLSCAADAFDQINDAGRAVSSLADQEYSELTLAGAGSSAYSGRAKEPYLYAKSMLTDGGVCKETRVDSEKVLSYFRQKPQITDVYGSGLPSYLNRAAGNSSSTMAKVGAIRSLLSLARQDMELEYQTKSQSATSEAKRLEDEISSLSREDVHLIGDPPSAYSETSSTLLVGMGYSGISSALSSAKLDLGRARTELSLSQSVKSSRSQDYLAIAIARAAASNEISQNALSAVSAARSDAEIAVASKKASAKNAIYAAELASKAKVGSLTDAQSQSLGNDLLQSAKDAFDQGEYAQTLGMKYSAYSKSESLAEKSKDAYSNPSAFASQNEAKAEVESLSDLIEGAKKDGLDAYYEEERLSVYRSLLSSSSSQIIAAAVLQSAKDDSASLVQRLYAEFQPLETIFAQASETDQWLSQSDGYSSCDLGGVAPFFPSGKLDAKSGAGKLMQASETLAECEVKQQAQIPLALSSLLSSNALTSETIQTPIIGAQTNYSAVISTMNPSGLSYAMRIQFNAKTEFPLYSSEYSSGDKIADAYPNGSSTTIEIQGINPGQGFLFEFSKKVQPAQRTSYSEECSKASLSEARFTRSISLFSQKAIPIAQVGESAPLGAGSAYANYAGERASLSISENSNQSYLSGSIGPLPAGKSELELSYVVFRPISISTSEPAYVALPLGQKKVSYAVDIESKVDCDYAEVELIEPYGGISNLSVACGAGCSKILLQSQQSLLNGTRIVFSSTPLSEGGKSSATVSFIIADPQKALEEAFLQAELQARLYNRTRDHIMLEQARALASNGDTDGALSILAQISREGATLFLSYADRQQFESESAALEGELSSLGFTINSLLKANSTDAASRLSTVFSTCQNAIESSKGELDSNPEKALLSLRRAKYDFYSSLAEASWDYIKSAGSSLAKARKSAIGLQMMGEAESSLSDAERLYSEGSHSKAMEKAAASLSSLNAALAALGDSNAQQQSLAAEYAANYSSLRGDLDPILSAYSSQYGALTSQGKKQLPLTPSAAQKKLSDTDRLLESSKKSSDPAESARLAGEALSSLKSLSNTLSSSLDLLKESASSSLSIAKAALSEAKSKSSADEVSGIESEVSRAEGFFAAGLYADSIASSDRAMRAANALISTNGGLDAKAILLAAISLVFVGGLAYYFVFMRKGGEKKDKKELKKAGDV